MNKRITLHGGNPRGVISSREYPAEKYPEGENEVEDEVEKMDE